MKKTIITLIIFAFALSSCGIFRRAETHPDPRTHDEGVVINGIRWATRNVDMPGTFAENPESFGMFFQWNRRKAWVATGEVEDWDNTEATGWIWNTENDPCPTGWRVPTQAELYSLHNEIGEWTTKNGVNGRLFGTTPYQIFLPAAGSRSNGSGVLRFVGTSGNYWSSMHAGSLRLDATQLWFARDRSRIRRINRANGHSVRCVSIN